MNAYNNQAHNVPPPRGKMKVGERVNTIYGIGIITDIRGTFHRINGAAWDPILATIFVPGNPPHIFQQSFQTSFDKIL